MIKDILFVLCYTWTIGWVFINFGRLFRKQEIPLGNIISMSVGSALIIAHHVGMW